jgi:hypothetical protein
MRVPRLLIVTSALLSLVIAFPHEAWACSCEGGGPPCQSVFQVDAIFAGTVRGVAALPDDDLPPLRPGESRIPRQLRVDFVDVQGYRAVQGTSISVLTPGSGASCGYAFKQGQRYLVYAMRQANGTELVTGICSRTRPIAEADEDLRFLQTLGTSRSSRSRVYGTINHWERNLSSGQPRDYGPVADVFVSVSGSAGTFGASTDDRGRYEVAVPPGKYEVQVLPPAAYSERYLRRSIEVSDVRACALADFSVRFDGRIRGFVRQSTGEPSASVSVQVMAAEDVHPSSEVNADDVTTR